ncbi:MAG: hypothetical protein HY908_20770 [Myxococcales bacterium]|nr:hypothetical protein [Myxococcales bacterium]
MVRARAALALLAGLALGACGGRPKAGDACDTENEGRCVDAASALECSGGRWSPIACTGPRGCVEGATTVECDRSLAVEGEACGAGPNVRFACTQDKKAQLRCVGGRWQLSQKCEGPAGCEPGLVIKCDDSVARAGDTCQGTGTARFACTADKKLRLSCVGSQWTEEHKCLGSQGCRAGSLFVDCDVSISDPGDPCEETGLACSTDGVSMLDCKNKRLVATQSCSPKRCVAKPEVHCE